jgi:hypothetical protein
LGLTVAFSFALTCVIDEAEPVLTVGVLGSVLNDTSLP